MRRRIRTEQYREQATWLSAKVRVRGVADRSGFRTPGGYAICSLLLRLQLRSAEEARVGCVPMMMWMMMVAVAGTAAGTSSTGERVSGSGSERRRRRLRLSESGSECPWLW